MKDTIHLTNDGSHTLCDAINRGNSIHVNYASQAISKGLTTGELCESCIMVHLKSKLDEEYSSHV